MRRRSIVKCLAVVAAGFFALHFVVWQLLVSMEDPNATTDGTGARRQITVKHNDGEQICHTVDVVYTWVNGSDPAHKALLKQYGRTWDAGYRDYNVMRYSIRSVEKFMPWIRHIIIVTNGQIPGWVDTSSPRLRIVTHDEIFKDKSHLPTFNSNAIEAHLVHIPGLAPCLLYMNDDMFLARPIPRDLYYDEHGNLKLGMSSGYVAPMPEKMRTNLWHRSVGTSNELLSRYYYPNSSRPVKHPYAGHTCYFMRRDILETMYARWTAEFERASSHKFRQGDDTALPFMQANVALEEFGATQSNAQNMYGTWTPDEHKNNAFWGRIWRGPYCVCMNDALDNSEASTRAIAQLERLFQEKLPEPSSVERRPASRP
eukprot:m51a1_g14463 hypothetical protein (371) ;mRNA; f:662529-663990